MDQILEFFGFPNQGKGKVWGLVGIASMVVIVLDLFNIADVVGLSKKTLNKFLPSVFGKDKFRTTGVTKSDNMIKEIGRSVGA